MYADMHAAAENGNEHGGFTYTWCTFATSLLCLFVDTQQVAGVPRLYQPCKAAVQDLTQKQQRQ